MCACVCACGYVCAYVCVRVCTYEEEEGGSIGGEGAVAIALSIQLLRGDLTLLQSHFDLLGSLVVVCGDGVCVWCVCGDGVW